jgi:predicted helicase
MGTRLQMVLQNDPVYRSTIKTVWLWDEWPDKDGPDAGIDLVAKTKKDELWAIQAKAWDKETNVTKHDMDSFIAESEGSRFALRLLITTSKGVARAVQTLENRGELHPPLHRMCRHDLEDREWPASFSDLEQGGKVPRPPATPEPHQQEALNAALGGLRGTNRGQLIMACGTGKTLTALWLHERLQSTRTLVVVPSLSLLNQTLLEWTKHATSSFEILPVCSDETVGRGPDDDIALATTSELPYPVTTDPQDVRNFLNQAGPRVVFSTYHSSPAVADALVGTRDPLDLVIADEAHRCAGPVSSDFATVLNQDRLPAKKRVFMTATPRIFTSRVKNAAKDQDWDVASMDDEAIFGPVLFKLSFAEAIERNLLSDYRVLIVGIDNEQYRRYAEHGQIVALEGDEKTDARSLASQIGLAKAMRRYDLQRVITFHGRVKGARDFSSMLPRVIEWMPQDERPDGRVWPQAVSGKMSTGDRRGYINRLKALEDGERGVLSNARCLGEGIDVPTLDGIAFVDPKHSEVDIVQAVGRAIRKPKGEEAKTATIVIPVFVEPAADGEQELDASAYRSIAAVLRALRSHDEKLAEELDGLRRQLGRLTRTSTILPEKIVLDLPVSIDKTFSSKLQTELVRLTTDSWEEHFSRLLKYVDEKGNGLVPANYKDPADDFKLGKWVSHQRTCQTTMSAERKQRLDSVEGWVWDPFESAWEEGFSRFLKYVEDKGDGLVPTRYEDPVDGFRLGQWVGVQRATKTTMSPERKQRLDNRKEWVWKFR